MTAGAAPGRPMWAPGRKAWMDVAKGAAIFLVVLYHSTLYLGAAGMPGLPNIAKVPLELFPMPAFFVLAGMLSARTTGFTFGDLFRRRVLPMLYLYVVWSVIRFLFFVLLPWADTGLGDLPAASPLTLALILVWPSSSYWFLYALALFTIGGWLLRMVPTWVQLSAAAVLSAFVTSGLVQTDNVGWDRVLGLFVFYLAGLAFAPRIQAAVERSHGWMAVVLVVAFVGFVAAVIPLQVRGVPGVTLVGQMLALAAGFAVSQLFAGARASRPVAKWGASSLHIYLYHLFFIVPVATLVGAIGWEGPRWAGLLIQVALAVAAVFASLYVSRWVGKARWLLVPPRAWTAARIPPSRSHR